MTAWTLRSFARLHAFGSVLRPDYRPGESDIDFLVEFQSCEGDTRGIPISKRQSTPARRNSMQRDARAYLSDVLEAAAAIKAAVESIDEDGYGSNRLPSRATYPF
jgi:predicted nucleotidyltransferase